MQSKNYIASEKNNLFLTINSKIRLLTIISLFSFLMLVSESSAATISVDRIDDAAAASACTAAANDCSVRGAFAFADANSGTVINIPAGTYNLTVDELQVGTATNVLTTITGAGSNLVTINQTLSNRRVIDLNPSLSPNVVVNISGVRITGGNSPSDNFGGGGLIGGGAGNTLNLSNCIFENNSDINAQTAKGGGIEWAGGGFLNIDNCTFNNNTAGSAAANKGVGGGVDYQLLNLAGESGKGGLTITNSTFTNNKAGAQNAGAGGGLALAVTTTQTPRTVTITNNTFTGNQANASSNGHGGAVTSSSANPITLKFNRIVGNTATGLGTGVYQSLGTNGTFDASENWWGCNGGPGSAGCSTIGGLTANITTNPRIVLTHTQNTSPITIGQSTVLTASFLRDSSNNVLTTANISRLIGLPITFNNPVRGTLSGAQTAIQANGTATVTFTSNAAGAGSADAVVDNQTTTAAITISKGNTTISLSSSTPNSTVTGQSYTVTFNAPATSAPTSVARTGTVTVSDGTSTCTATLPATSCVLTSTSAGTKNLTATYNGDANFNASPASAPIQQTVNPASTTATISAHSPVSTVFGQNYTVSASVAVNGPGSGTPSGAITVSDGTNTCTITLPATSCTLPSNSVGTKNLTAVYGGNANFNASPQSAAVSHVVNPANTTTTITAHNPTSTVFGQPYAVSANVTVNAPGNGTPTGTINVSDGTANCAIVLPATSCTLPGNSVGTKNLTATYGGGTNFSASPASAVVLHVVNKAGTTTTINSTSPNPSNAGQSVVVNYSVAAVAPGAGVPTGSVTISDGGANSCVGTVADGQCTLVLPAGGTYNLTATYTGDTNFVLSTSPTFTHQVCGASAVVSNTSDSGAGSLREALTGVCAVSSITFSPDFNSPKTIMLTGELLINRDVTINGAGANLLTINANNTGRVFRITGGNVNISSMTITGGNGAGDGNGGGIANTGGNLTLTNSVVSGNSAPNLGGGIYSTSPLTIVGSTVSANTANNAIGATGGGIHTTGSLMLVNSTVSGNSVPNGDNNGGGIRAENTSSMINSTITNNSAAGAASASGVFQSAGAVTVRNSIIAANQNNATTPDAAGMFDPASAFNLIGNVGTATGFSAGNQNQTGIGALPLNPLLGALQNNGGTTPTHALLSGSSAIDKGGAASVPFAEFILPPVTTDQRGTMRPIEIPSIPNAPGGDGSDIGAFEFAAPTAANVSVSGRVFTDDGRALQNAIISMTDSSGETRTARTTSFGYFRFENVEIGQTYVFQVTSKRFTFAPQIVTMNDEITEIIFTAAAEFAPRL